jgi:uncharacterized protein (UPF0332 family)
LASFTDYVQQAKNNFVFLENLNCNIPNKYDWEVTVCFYVAVHIVNAHLSNHGYEYRSHSEVNHALNPHNVLSIGKLPADIYASYIALLNLSRRSRYLVNDNTSNSTTTPRTASFTYEKHFAKAVRHLDKIMKYFCDTYPHVTFTKIQIRCLSINAGEIFHFFTRI